MTGKTHDRVSFLQNFMHRNQSLESLNFVSENRLDAQATPEGY